MTLSTVAGLVQLANSRAAQASFGGTTTDTSAVMVAHRLLSSAMRSDHDNDWPIHSLMLLLHDLRGLPLQRLTSTVPCCMIFFQRTAMTGMAEP